MILNKNYIWFISFHYLDSKFLSFFRTLEVFEILRDYKNSSEIL